MMWKRPLLLLAVLLPAVVGVWFYARALPYREPPGSRPLTREELLEKAVRESREGTEQNTRRLLADFRGAESKDAVSGAPAAPTRPPPAPGKFRVAAIQLVSEFGNLKRNRERLAALVREAARGGAQVVVAPECAVPGYMSDDHRTTWRDPVRRPDPKDGRSLVEADAAETVPGETTRLFGELARELKLRIVVGLIEKVETEDGGKPRTDYYNTAVLLGARGDVECHYRKLNLWPPGDATWAQEGSLGLGLCETELGKFGVMICFDQTCGTAERLKEAGATTVLYPIAWVHDKLSEDWFDGRLPERVKAWGVNVVGANWALEHVPQDPRGPQGFGCSRIIAADGTILARAGPAGSEVICADLPKP